MLGSVYSLLQFVFTPIFGRYSDHAGRRRVVLLSLWGMLLSYVLWIFAGDFLILILSRVIGGIMSANISTVTAIVADVTTQKDRSRGMALIGMAFGLGFILGPAIGGISAQMNLAAIWPAGVAWGLNPYSAPALVAFVLTALNLVQALIYLPETLTPENAALARARNAQIRAGQARHAVYPGVRATQAANFLFLLAFSGMEFSLTFLAHERLGFDEKRNAAMFLVIGITLALFQGGYVRRFSQRVGSRRMAWHGLMTQVPALLLIGLAGHLGNALYLFPGLVLLAMGAAQTMPCLTSLISEYTPADDQGRVVGRYRSLGALARALGPLVASLLYWRIGGASSYFLAAAYVVVPALLVRALPEPVPQAEAKAVAG
jgi:MFS family permease